MVVSTMSSQNEVVRKEVRKRVKLNNNTNAGHDERWGGERVWTKDPLSFKRNFVSYIGPFWRPSFRKIL